MTPAERRKIMLEGPMVSTILTLALPNVLNVAMTRARKKLVIIGDSATLGSDRFYQHLLEYCESIGAYRTAWEFGE